MLTIKLIATVIYGLLSIVGGLIGYTKSQSKVSLISGGISGLLLLALAVMMYLGNQWTSIIAAIIILLLTLVFIIRFSKTKKPMPAIPMICLGVLSLVLILS